MQEWFNQGISIIGKIIYGHNYVDQWVKAKHTTITIIRGSDTSPPEHLKDYEAYCLKKIRRQN
ncbi:9104_t:CDS:2 [Diversispora eburnea]|uniref:9104_t:CDS:1 n=1 Tax=Diversispora eburnea TaxID=1213867 RepID=A0A9N9B1V1_9GLOM|nr:9104_t:CDS:2 [Diversispora eburnea]